MGGRGGDGIATERGLIQTFADDMAEVGMTWAST